MQEFTLEMIEQLLNGTSPMADLYDEVRLLEPQYGMVCTIQNGELVVTEQPGWMRWHRCKPDKGGLVRRVCSRGLRMVRFEYADNCYYFVAAYPVTIGGKDCALELITDITGRVVTDEGLAERESFVHDISRHLEDISEHDAITGLYDRAFTARDVEERLRSAAGPVYLAFFDLIHFKELNDLRGHIQGDVVLRKFSRILSNEIEGMGYAARWHGDKFMLVFDDTNGTYCAESVQRAVDRLRHHEFRVEEEVFHMDTSYAVADVSGCKSCSEAIQLLRGKLCAQRKENGIPMPNPYE